MKKALPCPSIFERKRPLAEATLRRIARGVRKFVLESGEPFIVPITHAGGARVHDVREPLRTVTTAHRGELALAAPVLVQAGYGEREGQAPRSLDLRQPLGTVVAGGGKHALASAVLVGVGGRAGQTEPRPANAPHFTTTGKADAAVAVAYLAQQNGGIVGHQSIGHDAREPLSTISSKGCQQQVVAAFLSHAYGSNTCGGEGELRKPAKTITTDGHHALVECTLSAEAEAGALRVAAFLVTYYGTGQACDVAEPLDTITARDRLALVTVKLHGKPYLIVDIGLRMLQPRELYLAQGFAPDYIIDRTADGKPLSKSAQVRMCGNSVSPPPMAAIVAANHGGRGALREAA